MEEQYPAGSEQSGSEWEVVKDLVFEWETEQPRDLDAWLKARCSTESVLLEVQRLVRASSVSGNFMKSAASQEHFGIAAQPPVRIGRYQVIEEIGAGGLGVVYAAYDPSLERKVAIKVLADQVSKESERRKRLRWDAKAASAVRHPNIVVIYDIGMEHGADYIVMECVDGKSLGQVLESGALPAQTALNYAIQLCDALEAAHLAGIVHRDLKPGNIMITKQGMVKVLDFGLAKLHEAAEERTSQPQTIEGHFAGTVAYVSPEQADGRPVDIRGDIFSFGCILFEMLTGKQAFQGSSALSVLGSILHQSAPALRLVAPQIDERFEAIIQRCLRKEPGERFQTIPELRGALTELVEVGKPPRFSYRTRRLLARGAIGVAIAGLAVFVATRVKPTPIAPLPDPQYDQVRLTFDAGLAMTPALSLDGKLAAYASDRGRHGNLDIWVQHLDTNDAIAVTSNAADEYSPSFNPANSELVYRSEQNGGGLYKVSTLGGDSMLLVPNGKDGRYSPDGHWLAYWTGQVGASLSRGCAKIYLLSTHGGQAEELKGFEAAAYPVWSASGSQLMFVARRAGDRNGDWWVLDLATRATQRLGLIEAADKVGAFRSYRTDFPVPAVWLSNQMVLFTAKSRDATNLWAVRVAPDGKLLDEPHHWTNGTEVEDFASGTVDAKNSVAAVYASMKVETGIFRIPLNSGGAASGPPERILGGLWRLGSPTVSRSGGQVAYLTKLPNIRTAIHYTDTGLKDLAAAPTIQRVDANSVILSGDGNSIAWSDEKKGYLMAVKGDAPEQVCEHCSAVTDVSFDGSQVIFESGQTSDLLLCSRGRAQRNLLHLTGTPWQQEGGRFSPDGHLVAFDGRHEGETPKQVLIVSVTPDGTAAREPELITNDQYLNHTPLWAPDGKRIYFLSNRHGYDCIWARNVDPSSGHPVGEIFEVSDFHFAGIAIRGPSRIAGTIGFSIGPNFLLLTLSESSGDIWFRHNRR